MEAGQIGVLDAGQEDQKVVIPAAPRVLDVTGAQQQQRGVKRTRRDRGSTAKERISKMPPCAAGKRSSIYRGVTRLVFSFQQRWAYYVMYIRATRCALTDTKRCDCY